MKTLTFPEVPGLCLERAFNDGLVVGHYGSRLAGSKIRDFVREYVVKQQIDKDLCKKTSNFGDFVVEAAVNNGRLIDNTRIARKIGLSPNTVRNYYRVLESTSMGSTLPGWDAPLGKKRTIKSGKFWFLDVGVANRTAGRFPVVPGSPEFSISFENLILMELKAKKVEPIFHYRRASGIGVSFVLGDAQVAIDTSTSHNPNQKELNGLAHWGEEYAGKRILVCQSNKTFAKNGILVINWRDFLLDLWGDEIIKCKSLRNPAFMEMCK